MTSSRATTPAMIQPSGVELVFDCAMIVVVGGTSVVVATVGSVVDSVVGLVVSGSVVEGSVVEGTSVVGVVVAGGLTASEAGGVDVEGRVTAGAVTDGDVSGRLVGFPPLPHAATVPARAMSPTANHRRPRRPPPVWSKGEVPVLAITRLSSLNGPLRLFASPVSNHCPARLAPPDTGETITTGSDCSETVSACNVSRRIRTRLHTLGFLREVDPYL